MCVDCLGNLAKKVNIGQETLTALIGSKTCLGFRFVDLSNQPLLWLKCLLWSTFEVVWCFMWDSRFNHWSLEIDLLA